MSARPGHHPKLGPREDGFAPPRFFQSVRSRGLHRSFVVLLDQPVAEAEFVAVDTETNGLAGDLCELTEVGAVVVGGGECHDSWESLVRVERPLSRGIERFTGITQAMVDAAPPADEVLPELAELLEGRVLVAHNARFDVRVLRQAFERAGLDWPAPPTLCTVALARRLAPLVRKRGLAELAERPRQSRSTRCTARCPTPSPAGGCSARCSRGCARTPPRSATRSSC